ncbi:hypothetical protein N8D55_04190 [Xanthomonas hortorum pv. pelargonii]|nr:hypothetical protein N8D55_04190 [Xanthomonas hortorum pv. pelargonii]
MRALIRTFGLPLNILTIGVGRPGIGGIKVMAVGSRTQPNSKITMQAIAVKITGNEAIADAAVRLIGTFSRIE